MSLADFVNVQITLELAPVIAAGFGKPMILGTHSRFAERYREYTDLESMVADGFLTTDAEYVEAAALLSQTKRVELFAVGRRLAAVAQRITVTIPGVPADGLYRITINGLNADFTASSSTQTQVRDGLITAVDALAAANPLLAPVDGAIGSASTLTVTATNAGQAFIYALTSPGSVLTAVLTTANVGPSEDLTAIADAGLLWYCTLLTDRDRWDILTASAWTESSSLPKILIAQASEASSRDNARVDAATSIDLASTLYYLSRTRTALIWHDNDAQGAASAWAGRFLPLDPGTETWALKSLGGITPAALTTTQQNNLVGAEYGLGKNANIYYSPANNIFHTWRGTMANGQWIDVVRFGDFLQADIAQRLVILQAQRDKVPMTDEGIQAIVACVLASLQTQENAGKLAKVPKYEVDFPLAEEIATIDRAARRLVPPITFSAQGSGAIHEINVNGTISA